MRVRKPLLLVVDGEVVKGRDQQYRDGPRHTADTDFLRIRSAGKGCGEDARAHDMVGRTIRVCEVRHSMRFVGLESEFLFENLLSLRRLGLLQIIHLYTP